VVILYSRKTRDEIYLRIALSKLKRMNFNLKEPHQLKESYKEIHRISGNENDPDGSLNKEIPQKMEIAPKKILPKTTSKSQHQSKLTSFLDTLVIPEFPIKLSKYFPMKFGLRKKLQQDNYSFGIVDSDLHIVIYNKVLIQIYDSQNIQIKKVLIDIKDFSQISSLLIIVFDFIDYKEGIEGEKRLHKKRLQNLGNTHNFQVIVIDNEEELYFIVKNILEAPKQK